MMYVCVLCVLCVGLCGSSLNVVCASFVMYCVMLYGCVSCFVRAGVCYLMCVCGLWEVLCVVVWLVCV